MKNTGDDSLESDGKMQRTWKKSAGGAGQACPAQGGNGIRQSCGKCSLPPEDTLMEVPFLTFYANLNDVCPSMAH